MNKLPPRFGRGQMLIGVLIAIAIFLILSHALFTLISASSNLVSINKARTTAKFIAQEKIEMVRNMDYDDIGTIGGIPNGILPPNESITKNGLTYSIETTIVYIDDPFDSEGEIDLFPDYKRISVSVAWDGLGTSIKNPLVIITDISPAMNIWAEGTGMLDINVTNAYGEPVIGADVSIYADAISPNVDVNIKTDEFGKVTLPGAIPCIECYKISITKEDYSTDSTHSTAEVTNPSKPHASVLEGKMTQLSFSIDKTGSLQITAYTQSGEIFNPAAGTLFKLRGTKTIGIDAYLVPVYKYDQDLTTNSEGEITVENLEWDSYYIEAIDPPSYSIAGTNPILPIILLPEANESISFYTTSYTTYSLFNLVKDPAQNLLSDVYVTLSYEDEFNEEKISGSDPDPDYGQVFFGNLEEKIYTLSATASGHQNYSNTIEILGNVQNVIILNPI